jgi:transcriptional regulator with XRE-family HTH domain
VQASTVLVVTVGRGWGSWIRAVLDETGTTPAELAKRIGVRQSTVSRWLSGETDRPSFELAVDVGVVFGRVPDALRAARYRPDLPDGENEAADPSQAV